jgi:hypothetical protein
MSLIRSFKSVLAAFFGVQSLENRDRDFAQGNPVHFIIVGLICTVAFIGSLFSIVIYITG